MTLSFELDMANKKKFFNSKENYEEQVAKAKAKKLIKRDKERARIKDYTIPVTRAAAMSLARAEVAAYNIRINHLWTKIMSDEIEVNRLVNFIFDRT